LSTPTTDQEFRDVADTVINHLLKWIEEDPNSVIHTPEESWTPFHEEKDIVLHRKLVLHFPTKCIRSETTLDGSCVEIMRLNWDAPEQERKEFTDLEFFHIVREIDENHNIGHLQYKGAMGASDREFVVIRTSRRDTSVTPNRLIFASFSINYEDISFSSSVTRGVSLACAVCEPILTEDEDENVSLDANKKTKLIMFNSVDPKGWVPSMIIDAFSKTAAKRVDKMRSHLIRIKSQASNVDNTVPDSL